MERNLSSYEEAIKLAADMPYNPIGYGHIEEEAINNLLQQLEE